MKVYSRNLHTGVWTIRISTIRQMKTCPHVSFDGGGAVDSPRYKHKFDGEMKMHSHARAGT